MLLSRRSLGLLAGAATTRWALGAPRMAGAVPVAADADVVGNPKTQLPTPALVLDLDCFEANVARLSAHAAATGKRLRPHAKTHKCVEIARRQRAAGAIGVCVATVPEAEVMARGGIGGSTGDVFDAFAPALGVLVTVVSTNHAGHATVDGGFKAFATDRPLGPVCRDLPGVAYRFRGDEFGILSWADGRPPVQRGDRVELIPPHCDPTVNLYDRIHACRGDRVEAVWPVMDRLACGGAVGP